MTHPDPPDGVRRPRAVASLIGFTLALVLGGCNLAAPTPSAIAAASPAASDPSPEPPAPSPTAPSSSTLPVGQTDTAWGRIWDSLPVAFPTYPGATPADGAQPEPVTATFALDGQGAREVATWMQTELERAAYRTEALNGPLEDGSFVVESRGTADCRIEVRVAPLGALTMVTVRYGAACPSR